MSEPVPSSLSQSGDVPLEGVTTEATSAPGMSTDPSPPPPKSKPRARLGPTEIVELPATDSEPEDDSEAGSHAGGDGDETDEDFLAGYPDDTEVRFSLRLITPAAVQGKADR